MRSSPEIQLSQYLSEKWKYKYEHCLVPYIQFYKPDFYIPELDLTIEVKGQLNSVGRRDLAAIARQYYKDGKLFVVAVFVVSVQTVRPYVEDRPTNKNTLSGLCLCNWLEKQGIPWFAFGKHTSANDIAIFLRALVQEHNNV